MATDVLFELGAEEIPAGFLPGIMTQLRELTTSHLADMHLGYTGIDVYATPRRLAVLLQGVEDRSEDIKEVHKGPSVQVGFDGDGNPTKAAIGFARGKGIDASELVVEDGYLYAHTTTAGVSGKEILTSLFPQLIKGLSFPKSMRWGDLEERFVRPIRWMVALWGNEVIPVEFANVTSSAVSCGHRFLGERKITITHPSDYVDTLRKNSIIVDQDERRTMIREQLEALAQEKQAQVVWDEDLLEEVLYLVEYPTALCGTFDESYLELPDAAVITPMKDHQRYFPLVNGEGKLLPMFLTVRNGDRHSLEVVTAGNERVLRARLDDAKFFFNEDRKTSLADRYDNLNSIVFQEGLGNLVNKTERLLALGQDFGEACGLSEDDLFALERATFLAKTDLTTGMVSEFTELQGIMGREYALLDGEDSAVAEAILEQYLPRFAGDVLPTTNAGKVLSIIDKVDNIVATFSRGLIPTGSQDPYALRRQTIGVINILADAGWNVSLEPLWLHAMELLGVKEEKQQELLEQLNHFFLLRLKNILLDKELPYRVVEITLGNEELTINKAFGLAEAMANHRVDENESFMQAYTRIFNLVKEVTFTGVKEELLKEESEKALYEVGAKAYAGHKEALENGQYTAALTFGEPLVPYIEEFFAKVMVMDKDEAIKENRLQLLRMVYTVSNLGAIK